MALTTKEAILKTLAYADVFNFPLTSGEIHFWLIEKKASLTEVQRELDKLNLRKKNNYYFLKIFSNRQHKEKIAQRKWAIAQKISHYLQKIPTILAIFVTGNLSMNNCTNEDDIDLLIITPKNCLWTTRFLINFLTDFLKVRRHPGDKNFEDKICLNMFLDENHLLLPQEERNIYTAHELLQATPILDKDNVFQKFLILNAWAKNYLPNAYGKRLKDFSKKNQKSIGNPTDKLFYYAVTNSFYYVVTNSFYYAVTNLFYFFEPPLRLFQKKYMEPKITTETIKEGILRFHPKDMRGWVLRKYEESLEHLHLTNAT